MNPAKSTKRGNSLWKKSIFIWKKATITMLHHRQVNARIAFGRDPLVGEVTAIVEVGQTWGNKRFMNIDHRARQHHRYHPEDHLAICEALQYHLSWQDNLFRNENYATRVSIFTKKELSCEKATRTTRCATAQTLMSVQSSDYGTIPLIASRSDRDAQRLAWKTFSFWSLFVNVAGVRYDVMASLN